jgi:hypothetical protein
VSLAAGQTPYCFTAYGLADIAAIMQRGFSGQLRDSYYCYKVAALMHQVHENPVRHTLLLAGSSLTMEGSGKIRADMRSSFDEAGADLRTHAAQPARNGGLQRFHCSSYMRVLFDRLSVTTCSWCKWQTDPHRQG